MIAIIRITGLVEVPSGVQEALFRLHLRHKYNATLVHENSSMAALLKKVRNFVAYGQIDKETLVALLTKRSKSVSSKKIDPVTAAAQLEKKSLQEIGIKPYFRLHPPRGGIDSKVHFPIGHGVLGDNKEKINDLIQRML